MSQEFIVTAHLPHKVGGFRARDGGNKFTLEINDIVFFGEFIYSTNLEYQNTLPHEADYPPEVRIVMPVDLVDFTYFPNGMTFDAQGNMEADFNDVLMDSEIECAYLNCVGITNYWLTHCDHNKRVITRLLKEKYSNED